jgi:hypothetical protein
LNPHGRLLLALLTVLSFNSSLPPPQDEDNPAARKKPRIEDPFSGSSDEAARNTASPDISVGHSPSVDDDNDENLDANTDAKSVTDTQPNDGAIAVARRCWTSDEDAKLTSAVANTSKKKYHGEYKIDWVGISELVQGRTKIQCCNRWNNALNRSIDRVNGRTGKWTEDEDIKLKDAVQTHGAKAWVAISALVPGRTRDQCYNRWHNCLNSSIDRASESTGKWAEDEDIKLKDAVQLHGSKDWVPISALVPGRTKTQCQNRWHYVLNRSIALTAGRWTPEEDIELKDAVQTHGGKDWGAISALVLGRTNVQCYNRWNNVLDPNVDRASAVKWTEDENINLKDAVQTHGGKNWGAISALVPGRTKLQCRKRWHVILVSNIGPATARAGKLRRPSLLAVSKENH